MLYGMHMTQQMLTCTDGFPKTQGGNRISNGVLSAQIVDAWKQQILLICNKLVLHKLALALAVM